VSSAFSDEASCIVATNRVPLRLLAAETASRICGRGDGGGASQPSSGVPHCVPEHEWQALFNSSAPAPLGPMMDFLFRPQRAFLRTVLVPMLQPLPAWNCPGVRVGVHFRTFNADQYVRTLLSCSYVLVTRHCVCVGVADGAALCVLLCSKVVDASSSPARIFQACVGCTAALASAHGPAYLFLVSDASNATQSVEELRLPVSSAVASQSAPAAAHVHHAEDAESAAFSVGELIALSACDAVVHSRSGFSFTAAMWGRLHPDDVRVLPRYTTPLFGSKMRVTKPVESCGAAATMRQYYESEW
jgi:hypothetical protein